jgi:hypothetical protein
MSARGRGFIATLVCGLAVAACGSSGASLEDTPPLTTGSVPLPRPPPKSAAAEAPPEMRAWRHLPEPVSAGQFDQDKAKCTKLANDAPGAGSPELKFYLAFTNCMRSQGYESNSRL